MSTETLHSSAALQSIEGVAGDNALAAQPGLATTVACDGASADEAAVLRDADTPTADEPASTSVDPAVFVTIGAARFMRVHIDYMKQRAIDPTVAWSEGTRSVDSAQIQQFVGAKVQGTGLAFAYSSVDEPYTRVQLDDRTGNKGKTRAPRGRVPPPYIPTTVDQCSDSTLFVVEAPAKALAMVSNGFADCIGAAGVDAGLLEKGSRKLQPLLANIVRPTRPVTIVFDAGRVHNPAVAAAEARIARALLDLGCEVGVVELPLGPNGQDIGPDDYLASEGPMAMADLIVRASPADPVEWATAILERGPAEARSALEHLPFLAAIAAGGPAAIEGVAKVLKDFTSKSGIKEVLKTFAMSLKDQRASNDDDVPLTEGDPAAPGALDQTGRPILVRGDEREIAELHRAQLGEHVVFTEGLTYRYSSGFWKKLADAAQRAAIGAYAGSTVGIGEKTSVLCLDDREIKGALHHFQDLVAQPDFFVQAAPGLCFENGFLRLDGAQLVLEPHSPEYRARHAYNFAFDRTLLCPVWHQYLASVWEPDSDRAEKVMAIQEFIGAALFGIAPKFKTALMLHGEADTGKSVCLTILRGLFPRGTVSSIGLHEFESEYSRARLAGKLLNVVAEVPNAELIRSEAFKAIVAGDQISGRQIYQQPFDITPIAAHAFAANSLPHVSDRSEGVWTRWLVLTFNRRFPT